MKSQLPPAAALDRIVDSYRFWRAVDAEHTPSAETKKQLQAVESAASSLEAALLSTDVRARDLLFKRVSQQLSNYGALLDRESGLLIDSRVGQTQLLGLAAALAESSRQAQLEIPRTARNSAAHFAAMQLRSLFSHYNLPFTATANEDYETTSTAVATLVKIVQQAGDDITPGAARKRIEWAIDEPHDKETIDEFAGGRFPIP